MTHCGHAFAHRLKACNLTSSRQIVKVFRCGFRLLGRVPFKDRGIWREVLIAQETLCYRGSRRSSVSAGEGRAELEMTDSSHFSIELTLVVSSAQ